MNKGNRAAKKAFALLLSLVMVICMMPQMAFADIADEEPGPQVVTEDGFTIEDGVLTAYSGTDIEVTGSRWCCYHRQRDRRCVWKRQQRNKGNHAGQRHSYCSERILYE